MEYDNSCQGAPLPTFNAVIDEDAVEKWRFADVDRLMIRNLDVALLTKWVNGEVVLANRAAYARSDPVLSKKVLVVSAPIMILIKRKQKDQFAAAMRDVANCYFPTNDESVRYLATDGPRRTHVGDLIEAFRIAGIAAVTAFSFGQKARLRNYAWLDEITIGGDFRTVVEMDVGINSRSIAGHESSVVLVRDRHAIDWPGSVSQFPMFWELARTEEADPFGTFRLTSTDDSSIKQVGHNLQV